MDAAEVSAQIGQRFVEVDELTVRALYLLGTTSSLVHPCLLGIVRSSAGHAIEQHLTQPPPIVFRQGQGLIQDLFGRRGHEDSLGGRSAGRYRVADRDGSRVNFVHQDREFVALLRIVAIEVGIDAAFLACAETDLSAPEE